MYHPMTALVASLKSSNEHEHFARVAVLRNLDECGQTFPDPHLPSDAAEFRPRSFLDRDILKASYLFDAINNDDRT